LQRQLLDIKADPNKRITEGSAPLLTASYNGKVSCVRQLLENKADPNSSNSYYHSTPLLCAVRNNDFPTVELLLNAKAQPPHNSSTGSLELLIAVENKNTDMVSALLEHKSAPDSRYFCDTALTLAIRSGSKHVVAALLDAKADVNLPTWVDKITPYMCAQKHKNPDIMKLLQDRIMSDTKDVHKKSDLPLSTLQNIKFNFNEKKYNQESAQAIYRRLLLHYDYDLNKLYKNKEFQNLMKNKTAFIEVVSLHDEIVKQMPASEYVFIYSPPDFHIDNFRRQYSEALIKFYGDLLTSRYIYPHIRDNWSREDLLEVIHCVKPLHFDFVLQSLAKDYGLPPEKTPEQKNRRCWFW
jgi:hypothetical protein